MISFFYLLKNPIKPSRGFCVVFDCPGPDLRLGIATWRGSTGGAGGAVTLPIRKGNKMLKTVGK
jgi:hypothetical protein